MVWNRILIFILFYIVYSIKCVLLVWFTNLKLKALCGDGVGRSGTDFLPWI